METEAILALPALCGTGGKRFGFGISKLQAGAVDFLADQAKGTRPLSRRLNCLRQFEHIKASYKTFWGWLIV